jgi:hypothetical protein
LAFGFMMMVLYTIPWCIHPKQFEHYRVPSILGVYAIYSWLDDNPIRKKKV